MTPNPQANTLDEKIDELLARMEQTDPYNSRKKAILALITEAEDKLLDTLQEKSKVTVVSKGVVNMESYKQGLNVARKKYNKAIDQLRENK